METFPGKRAGTTVFAFNGYVYHFDKQCKNIYRCSSRRSLDCGAVLVRNQDETYTLKTPHCHAVNDSIMQQLQMKQNMQRLCKETVMKPKEIFDAVCRQDPVAATKMSYRSMRSQLSRYRSQNKPRTPNTIKELETVLSEYEQMQVIYKGTAVSDDGYKAFIFTTTTLLDALTSSTEIYMDGTFSIVPRKPTFAQLYSIHIRYMDTGIAILFALCEKRTAHVYRAIWKKIEQLCPDALKNIRHIMSDYERAGMSVARKMFPNSRLTGCWFHFNQAVFRRWKLLGLTVAPRRILGLTMALPLAPVELFEEGLEIIENEAEELFTEYPSILQFITYLRHTWLPIKNEVSVFHIPIRTNNLVESFQYALLRKIGGVHTNIWHFLRT